MMALRSPFWRLCSAFLLFFSTILLVPAAVSSCFTRGRLLDSSSEIWAFLIPMALLLATGLILRLFTRTEDHESIRVNIQTGFLIVTTFWALAAGIGCTPFLIEVKGLSFTDAYFESMSGFTTTGSTIFPDVESLRPGLGLWRCMTQWLGGMGIIILFVAILPTLGEGGYNLFRSEVPGGSTVERIKPRIAETAKSLWKVYLLLTFMEGVALWIAGMPLYDSMCHTFTTMPTGGFSIRNQGVAAYHNHLAEWIIIFFMFIAGASFSLHYRIFHGENAYTKNTEFKAYLGILVGCGATILVILLIQSDISPGTALRDSLFQVISIGTTTGFATADFNQWPAAAQFLLVVLMFIGGCTASTGGAVKVLRLVVAAKAGYRELRAAANPREIFSIKIGDKKISNEMVMNIFSFLSIYLFFFVMGAFCLTLTGLDLVSALAGTAASLGNVGPGLGMVGPASTFAALTPFAKWVLVILMLLGRLELYTILALVMPLLKKTRIA